MGWLRGIVAVTFALVLTSACGNDREQQPERSATPVVATHADGDGGDSSYVIGTLGVRNGCLYLTETDPAANGKRWVPALPRSKVDFRDGVLMYADHEYAMGTEVEIAGSEAPGRKGFAIPESCDADTPIWNGWGDDLDPTAD